MGWITSGWKLINWAMSRLRFGLLKIAAIAVVHSVKENPMGLMAKLFGNLKAFRLRF